VSLSIPASYPQPHKPVHTSPRENHAGAAARNAGAGSLLRPLFEKAACALVRRNRSRSMTTLKHGAVVMALEIDPRGDWVAPVSLTDGSTGFVALEQLSPRGNARAESITYSRTLKLPRPANPGLT